MAITKQRIKKIEEALGVNEERELRIILISKMGEKMDEGAKRDFINCKIKEIKKKGGYHLLPHIIILEKEEVEKARQRVKAKLNKKAALVFRP